MSELTEDYKRMLIAKFQFDVPPATTGADAPPFADRHPAMELVPGFREAMDNADAHHECPEKRVKGKCHCAIHD